MTLSGRTEPNPPGVSYWRLDGYRVKQTVTPQGLLWEDWPPGIYENQYTGQWRQVMAQEFMVTKFAPTAGAGVFAEAVWTPAGVSCYAYAGYVDMPEVAFNEFEKRWTAFLDGLNEIKKLAGTVPMPSTPTGSGTTEPWTPGA